VYQKKEYFCTCVGWVYRTSAYFKNSSSDALDEMYI